MRLKPCKICGSTKIELWDCGYFSFNPGGGTCENGHKVEGEAGCSPTEKTLADIWNRGQKLTNEERLKAENKRLRKKIKLLERYY